MAKTQKITKISKADFYKLIREQALKVKNQLLTEEEKAIEKLSEPLDQKMNQNDKLGDSTKALVFKNASKKEEKSKGPKTELGKPFTENDGDPLDKKIEGEGEEGGDKSAATAVEVEAGKEMSKGFSAGQKSAKFTSKDSAPKKEVSKPFDEKASEKMNTMDKLTDEKTATFVKAGTEESGHKVTAGLHKKDISEKAPKSEEPKRIAKGIEIKENYNKKDLQAFIMSEAKKLAKKNMLEEELKKLNDELTGLI